MRRVGRSSSPVGYALGMGEIEGSIPSRSTIILDSAGGGGGGGQGKQAVDLFVGGGLEGAPLGGGQIDAHVDGGLQGAAPHLDAFVPEAQSDGLGGGIRVGQRARRGAERHVAERGRGRRADGGAPVPRQARHLAGPPHVAPVGQHERAVRPGGPARRGKERRDAAADVGRACDEQAERLAAHLDVLVAQGRRHRVHKPPVDAPREGADGSDAAPPSPGIRGGQAVGSAPAAGAACPTAPAGAAHAPAARAAGLNYPNAARAAMSTEARDTIYIGKKPLMAYVTSACIQLTNLPVVNIKARGLSIGRAVDVAQIILRKTENVGFSIGDVRIGSETLESNDGKTRNVSTIEIEVKRNEAAAA